MMDKLFAFVRKDWQTQLSYPLAFFMQFWGVLSQLVMYFFLARIFSGAASPYLANYGGDYFAFVIIGIAFNSYVQQSMNNVSGVISGQQQAGTLEALLVTQTPLPVILLGSCLWQYLFNTFRLMLFFIIGALVFGLRIEVWGIFPAFIILVLGILGAMSYGILSASFILVYKQGNPLDYVVGSLSTLFGGVYFPITVLPLWLQGFAYVFPLYYCLDGLRLSLLKGYSLFQLWPQVLGLSVFCIILFPLSLWAFSNALKRAKREGTLAHY